ncbi:MAG: epoxyqueuosine reductase [Bacillota bacterium]
MPDNIKQLIEGVVKSIIQGDMTYFEDPLLGYADAGDPLFLKLKDLLPHHLLPQELLPEARTVAAFFVPFKEAVVSSNRGGGKVSQEWVESYIAANKAINQICSVLKDKLAQAGVKGEYQKATHNFDEKTLRAPWSHKSIAYIAGLGTFGVNKMLITEAGCAGRFGSIVIDAYVEPTRRPDVEYCLHYQNKKCLVCVKACPVQALVEEGIDKQTCYQRLLKIADEFKEFGLADVCGKCAGACAKKVFKV